MRLKQARALFTTSDRAVCREMQEDYEVDKEMRDLVALATEQGWTVDPTNNGKVMWKPPSPDQRPVVTGLKLGNGRARANAVASLKRAGLQIGPITKSESADEPATTPDKPFISATLRGVEIETPETIRVMTEAGVREDLNMARMFAAISGAIQDYVSTTHTDCKTIDKELLAKMELMLDQLDRQIAENKDLTAERDTMANRCEKLEVKVSELGGQLRDSEALRMAAEERAFTAENKLNTLKSIFGKD